MSLEPHWFSTVYGAMFLIGQMLESFAFVIALVIVLSRRSPLAQYVTRQHLHDLGNMMFAFYGPCGPTCRSRNFSSSGQEICLKKFPGICAVLREAGVGSRFR